MSTKDSTDTWLNPVFVACLVGVVCFLIWIGSVIVTGLADQEQHKGYCEAEQARYYAGDGPNGLCIKDDTVIKEWK
jgi:hypothetical protein